MAALLQEKQGRREGERMREGEGNVYLGRNEVPIRFGGARASGRSVGRTRSPLSTAPSRGRESRTSILP